VPHFGGADHQQVHAPDASANIIKIRTRLHKSIQDQPIDRTSVPNLVVLVQIHQEPRRRKRHLHTAPSTIQHILIHAAHSRPPSLHPTQNPQPHKPQTSPRHSKTPDKNTPYAPSTPPPPSNQQTPTEYPDSPPHYSQKVNSSSFTADDDVCGWGECVVEEPFGWRLWSRC